jgi:hypothetical protein
MGFEVQIEALEKAARAGSSAADQVDDLELSGVLDGVGREMPGADAAGLAREVAACWRDTFRVWCADVRAHAAGLEAAAAKYRCSEDAALIDFTRIDRRLR